MGLGGFDWLSQIWSGSCPRRRNTAVVAYFPLLLVHFYVEVGFNTVELKSNIILTSLIPQKTQ